MGEYKAAWKIHKLHNQPLHLGRLTLFIASCPRKPFTNRAALRGVSWTWWVACSCQRALNPRILLNSLLLPQQSSGRVGAPNHLRVGEDPSWPRRANPQRAVYFVAEEGQGSHFYQFP